MTDTSVFPKPLQGDEERKAGYLVLRIRAGEGLIIGDGIEIRVAKINNAQAGDASLAIRAPKALLIKRVK